MSLVPTTPEVAQSPDEARQFVEAFARVTVRMIRDTLTAPIVDAVAAEKALQPDWDDPTKRRESGLFADQIDEDTRRGKRYLHIDVAASPEGRPALALFLSLTGLSEKQQRALFPLLRSRPPFDRDRLAEEVARLNAWLDEVRVNNFDPSEFIGYQRGIGIHGKSQNLSGSIGAAGAAIAFVDAIRELSPTAILDVVGELPPTDVRSPMMLYEWLTTGKNKTVRALLLSNGRAIVFASSKDANIFQPLGSPFSSAKDALERFSAVAKDEKTRKQQLHEFAVGEVKTATDIANLHERMGLASRETQTELRTDRFLMMSVLNQAILTGGTQRRTMNNRDLTRFTHVFNLHHCWGWDGGRRRNPNHWLYFRDSVKEWCNL